MASPPVSRRVKGTSKLLSAEQLAYEAALYERSRQVAAQRAAEAAAAAAAASSGEGGGEDRRRVSVAFEVPLKPGAAPVLLRTTAPRPRTSSAAAREDDMMVTAMPPTAADPRAPSAPPLNAALPPSLPSHVAALRKAEAEYQQLLNEAKAAEQAADQARAAASAAGAMPVGSSWDVTASRAIAGLSPGEAHATAEEVLSGRWVHDLVLPKLPATATAGGGAGIGPLPRKSWAKDFPAGAGDAAALLPLASSTSSYADALKASKWTIADESLIHFSDSDADSDDLAAASDSAALSAMLRAARTAAAAAGEAAALTGGPGAAPRTSYGATDVGGPTASAPAPPLAPVSVAGGDDGELDARLAAWRATVSPQRTEVTGPLRNVLDTWRAGEGSPTKGWSIDGGAEDDESDE